MSPLPPGPRFAPLQVFRFIIDGFGLYEKLIREYGDPFTMPTTMGPLVISGHPDGARQLFTADPEQLQVWGPELLQPLLGDTAVIVSNGERHRRERKMLSPAFQGSRMRAYGPLMAECAAREISRWKVGVTFSALDAMQSISLEIILRAVFGLREDEQIDRFRAAVGALVASARPWIMFYPAMRREMAGLGPWARFQRAKAALDALIYAEIAKRRSEGGAGDDVLSLLMSVRDEAGVPMGDKELRDQLLTLLVAGHETTAIVLSWALYRLHRNAHTLTRLLAELRELGNSAAPDALMQLPYFDAVVQETLRIDPVVPEIVRQVRVPFEFCGYRVPAGTAIGASISLIHMREDLYPNPLRFLPDRFLERKYSPYEFFPFGGGVRRCLGASFAQYEMKVVLATILRLCRLGLVSDRPLRHVRRNFALGPEGGVKLVLAGRYG